VLHMVELPCAF